MRGIGRVWRIVFYHGNSYVVDEPFVWALVPFVWASLEDSALAMVGGGVVGLVHCRASRFEVNARDALTRLTFSLPQVSDPVLRFESSVARSSASNPETTHLLRSRSAYLSCQCPEPPCIT